MLVFISSFFMVLLAEIGDKTQIIAMMFAIRYPITKVLAGIFLGTVLNHFIAILLGNYFYHLIPLGILKLCIGIFFILCGLLMLKIKKASSEADDKYNVVNKNVVLTVFTIFFLGEFGDKTQLTAFSLAASSGESVLLILTATTLAMLCASIIGIFLGIVLKKYLDLRKLQFLGGLLFIAMGIWEIYPLIINI